jgi:pimeloyl-ACP methyl ester carboxylesterase
VPLVFVHGGAHGAWAWAGMQSWFAEHGWDSVALDWFSHGDSQTLPEAEWLRRGIPDVKREIGIACTATDERPILVGHSMGGLACLAYAAANVDALAALVLLTPVVPRQYATAPIDMPLDMEKPWPVPPPDLARQLFYSGVDDDTATDYYAKLQPESPQAVHQATRWTVELDLAPLRLPTLVVAAEKDLLVPADYVHALAADIGATTVTLHGVGHGVELDPEWPDLAARMEAWLSETVEG